MNTGKRIIRLREYKYMLTILHQQWVQQKSRFISQQKFIGNLVSRSPITILEIVYNLNPVHSSIP